MNNITDFITADDLAALRAAGTGTREAGLAAMETAVTASIASLDANPDQPGTWVTVPSETLDYLSKPSKMTMERRAKLLVWRVLDRENRKDDFATVLDPEWNGKRETLTRVGILRRK